jgi:hypothetical protein
MAGSQAGFWRTVLTSVVFSSIITSGVAIYQTRLVREDNRASIKREDLIKLQGRLSDLIKSGKDVYLISLSDYQHNHRWRNHIDLKAEQGLGHASTDVSALVAQINDPIATKHIQATRTAIFNLDNSTSREAAEKASQAMDQHGNLAQQRIGKLLRS